MRPMRVVPSTRTMLAMLLSPVTVGMLIIGMALHAPVSTLGAPGTPLTLIPTPIGETPTLTGTVPATPTPAAGPPAPTNTPKPKKTAKPPPTQSPVPVPTVRIHTGGGGCSARCALFGMQYTVKELGSFHLDFHLTILPRDHSRRLTHFVADVSLRNHQLQAAQETQVTQRGGRTTIYRYIYQDVGTKQAVWSQGKWSCYGIAPMGGPPYTINLRDHHLQAWYVGKKQKVNGVPAIPVDARSHGASIHPQGTLLARLSLSDYDFRLLQESTSFTTMVQGQSAPSTYTAAFSGYGKAVTVRMHTCGRTVRLQAASAWLPFVIQMVENGTLEQTTPAARAL